MNRAIVERIEKRLETTGLSASGASLKAGLTKDAIRNWQRNPDLMPSSRSLIALAAVLGTTVQWLLGENVEDDANNLEMGVSFGGIVEAGAFRRVDMLDQASERRFIPIAPDPRFPAAAQHAWKAEGDSMTEAGIFPGMYVLAVDVMTYERTLGEPGDGRLVIVAQSRNGDPERELTVKRLRIFRDRMELQPESKNPVHKPIVYHWPRTEDDSVEVSIIAVVVQAVRVY